MKSHHTQLYQTFLSALSPLESIKNGILIDCPNHLNIGDHLIWLGTLLYLQDISKTHITQISSSDDLSPDQLSQQPHLPILFHGGGNLGDLWQTYQQIRETIINQNKQRPIYILPQTIYFRESRNLETAKQSFNSHPNLTLFCRDQISYRLAQKHFDNCKLILAPDMALQLLNPIYNLPDLYHPQPTTSPLYLQRRDQEDTQTLSNTLSQTLAQHCHIEDWTSLNLKSPFILIRQVLSHRPLPEISRHPIYRKLQHLPTPSQQILTANLLYLGIQQLSQYPLIITNRLHGHILALLLRRPNILLPNSYHKNQAFYHTWTHLDPDSQFCETPEQLLQSLNSLQSIS